MFGDTAGLGADPQEYISEAAQDYRKAQSSFSWFGLSNRKETLMMNAAENYSKAANIYKSRNMHHESAVAYETAADISTQQGPDGAFDAKQYLQSAATEYQHSDKEKSVQLRKVLIDYYSREEPSRVTRHLESLAKTYESMDDVESKKAAIKTYRDTAELEHTSVPLTALRHLEKAADLAAKIEDYMTAQELYEMIAQAHLNDTTSLPAASKGRVITFFFKSSLCKLALDDAVALQSSLPAYCQAYPPFQETVECSFLSSLIEPINNSDAEAFKGSLGVFRQKKNFEDSELRILLSIQERLESLHNNFS